MQGDGRLRTTLEEKRVSARWGRAGEKGVISSIMRARLPGTHVKHPAWR